MGVFSIPVPPCNRATVRCFRRVPAGLAIAYRSAPHRNRAAIVPARPGLAGAAGLPGAGRRARPRSRPASARFEVAQVAVLNSFMNSTRCRAGIQAQLACDGNVRCRALGAIRGRRLHDRDPHGRDGLADLLRHARGDTLAQQVGRQLVHDGIVVPDRGDDAALIVTRAARLMQERVGADGVRSTPKSRRRRTATGGTDFASTSANGTATRVSPDDPSHSCSACQGSSSRSAPPSSSASAASTFFVCSAESSTGTESSRVSFSGCSVIRVVVRIAPVGPGRSISRARIPSLVFSTVSYRIRPSDSSERNK